jgi:hypothetical protein
VEIGFVRAPVLVWVRGEEWRYALHGSSVVDEDVEAAIAGWDYCVVEVLHAGGVGDVGLAAQYERFGSSGVSYAGFESGDGVERWGLEVG